MPPRTTTTRRQAPTTLVARQRPQGPERRKRYFPKHGTNEPEYESINSPAPTKRQSPTPASRDYSKMIPTRAGEALGGSVNAVGVLEAEFFACIFLIALTVFTDGTSSYGTQMLALMKRCTLATILFFLLALLSSAGPRAAKVSKAFGAFVLAAIFLSTAGKGAVSALDSFIKRDWTANAASPNPNTAANEQAFTSGAALDVQFFTSGDANQVAQNAGLPSLSLISGIPAGITALLGGIGSLIGSLLP